MQQVMDSMDWFEPGDTQADVQVQSLHRALKTGGKVLLRSAGLKPWYISVFEKHCFAPIRVGARLPGACIDRYVLPFRHVLRVADVEPRIQGQYVRFSLDLYETRDPIQPQSPQITTVSHIHEV